MARSCCAKPIAKIIKVGQFEAGIVGLETAMQNVYESGVKDEEQAKTELLRFVKEFGNYISPGMEGDYKDALWREYRTYGASLQRKETRQQSQIPKR
jgi:hypothetical protein